jgi:O-6-methylguanine DNA methyltransferase
VLNRVVHFIETPTATLALPLVIGGTAFQKRVWKALREIPAGQTAAYKELALKLGATAQEIGEACAANTLAVVIPCHRVHSFGWWTRRLSLGSESQETSSSAGTGDVPRSRVTLCHASTQERTCSFLKSSSDFCVER